MTILRAAKPNTTFENVGFHTSTQPTFAHPLNFGENDDFREIIMKVIENHFDLIHFTECELEQPLIWGGKMVIPTHQVGLLPSHPWNEGSEMIFLPKCCLIFERVKKSVRHLTEYIEVPPISNKFEPCEQMQRSISDDCLTTVDEPVRLYELEGIFKNPLEWVDWEIESASFYLLD